jgi:hypothetical protein
LGDGLGQGTTLPLASRHGFLDAPAGAATTASAAKINVMRMKPEMKKGRDRSRPETALSQRSWR